MQSLPLIFLTLSLIRDGSFFSVEIKGIDNSIKSVSPIHCLLKDTGRARYTFATDEEALKAYKLVTELEEVEEALAN